MLNRLEKSLDLLFSCFGLLLFWVMEDFLGLACFSFLCQDSLRCIGGSVVALSGGECDITEGKSSRGLGEWNGGRVCGFKGF